MDVVIILRDFGRIQSSSRENGYNDANQIPARRAAPTSVACFSLLISETRQTLSYAVSNFCDGLKVQLGSFCKVLLSCGVRVCVWGSSGSGWVCNTKLGKIVHPKPRPRAVALRLSAYSPRFCNHNKLPRFHALCPSLLF
jgi:hypothetical protein